MINRFFICLAIITISMSSWADSTSSNKSLTFGDKAEENIFITAVDLGWGTKRVNVTLSESLPVNRDILSCGSGSRQIQADESQLNVDQILSVTLAAYLSNKPVRVVVSQNECALGDRYKMIAIGM